MLEGILSKEGVSAMAHGHLWPRQKEFDLPGPTRSKVA